jgi:hypothetical protein
MVPSVPGFPQWSLSLRFTQQNPVCSSPLSPIHTACHAHLILLDFITRTIFGEQYRSLKGVISAKLPDHSRPQFHRLSLEALALMGTWRHLAAKVGTSNGRGKQWQTTPNNLPRMQCARAIPVTWLGSGSCQNQPKGWILMIMTDH